MDRPHDVAGYAARLSKWMTAQAGKLSRHLAVDGKFIREIVGLVSLVDAESGDVVAVAPVSKKEGLKGRCELPVTQDVLAQQDLSGAVVSADALDTQDDTARIVLSLGHAGLLDEARREIVRTLRRRHSLRGNARNDFVIRDNREAYALVSRVFLGVMLLLTVFAGLALFIGGVGVMNIMLVSVTERTNEIGLRAALGARPRAILVQFVLEAVALAAVGGGIGIPAGMALMAFVCRVLRWPMCLDAGTVILAFAFALLVGLAFGYFPARRAARLDPIECLRYE